MRRDNRENSQPVRQPRHDISDQSFAFRRSRTITGSAATSVRAATEERGQLQSPRLQEQSLRKHRKKLGLYLLASMAIVWLLAYITTSYINEGVDVHIAETQPIATDLDEYRYGSIVRSYLNDHPLEQFHFSLNAPAFNTYMQRQAPEVEHATLSKSSAFGGSQLTLLLREPVVSWTIKNNQYYVDKNGVPFTKNYFAIPAVAVTDKSGISADAEVIASTRLLRFIGRVLTLVNSSSIQPIVTVELPSSSTREVDFKLRGRSYVIKAHLDRDPAGQAADIINAVSYIEQKQLSPAYIDVRIASRAYYRDDQ